MITPRPMSLTGALAYALLGSGAAFALFCSIWWGQGAGPIVGGLASALWTLGVFAYRSMQKDEMALLERIRAHVAQQDPVLRLAVALAQPLRSLSLAMPIPMLTTRFDDWGLYETGRLPADAQAKAIHEVKEWQAHVAEHDPGGHRLPDDFESLVRMFPATSTASHDGRSETSARLCWHLHLLLCGMETGDLPPDAARALLEPAVRALQAQHADWASYAADLKQQRWNFVSRNIWGVASMAAQFRDLLNQPLSPWAMSELKLPLPGRAPRSTKDNALSNG